MFHGYLGTSVGYSTYVPLLLYDEMMQEYENTILAIQFNTHMLHIWDGERKPCYTDFARMLKA